MRTKILPVATEKDLTIYGELLKIEVFYTSFVVTYQTGLNSDLEICQNIFRIKDLTAFFKANGKLDKPYQTYRPKHFFEEKPI